MRNLFILIALVFTNVIYSQIETKELGAQENKIDFTKKEMYDGKENYVGRKFMKYLDEEVYLKCSKESDIDIPFKNKKYENKYFKIIQISPALSVIKQYDAIFKMVEKESKDTLSYEYKNFRPFPFITVKYFNHIKKEYLNKQFTFGAKDIEANENGEFIDYKTKETVPFFVSKTFTVVDVFINTDKNCDIFMVLKSGKITLLHRHYSSLN